MKFLKLSVVLIIVNSLTACNVLSPCGSSKEDFLKNYSTFIEQFKAKKLAYDAPEWESHDQEFKQMVKECYKKYESDMSNSEQIDFWTNALTYYYYRYGSDMVNVLYDSTNELSVIISEKVGKFLKDPKAVLRNILGKDNMNDVDGFLDDFEKNFNEFGEKLKNLFK